MSPVTLSLSKGSEFFYELVGTYGLLAVFVLAVAEGDITLLLAGVLAHSAFFGEYSFLKVLGAGTLGGVTSDLLAYGIGRGARSSVCEFRFYRAARPRIERLAAKFGPLTIFLSKFIYGLRWGSCIFYGVARMSFAKFLPLTFASCFVWVFALSGAGYFFSGAVINLIGDFHQLGIGLLVIVCLGVVGFYLMERYWLSEKVEHVDPHTIQKIEHAAEKIEHAAEEKFHEIKEHLPLSRHKDPKPRGRGDADGD
ncbi:MAG TPA: DedA family protein [Pyrinomonadaceae bacterium]|nr:DedA family protein [Pyrinomonadaceae bacterium]